MPDVDPLAGPKVAAAVQDRTARIVAALTKADPPSLLAPSLLPGWSRLTITCHLRYGASASLLMTQNALAGQPASFYPGGRAEQRPATLQPAPDESPADVIVSLVERAAELDRLWGQLTTEQWAEQVREPADTPSYGTTNVAMVALLRLTEVDVHGVDLNLGLPGWSEALVTHALPVRLEWLATRRTNHRPFDRNVRGSWLLSADDTGLRWRIAVDGDRVDSRTASAGDEADATIRGTARDLLALLLGRPTEAPLRFAGDERLAAQFTDAFPGP